jgi:hypothetical protein
MNQSLIKCILNLVILLMPFVFINGQSVIPDELNKNTIKDQLNYIEEHTRIYENFRAIREDMFQKIKVNVIDTLNVSGLRTKDLKTTSAILTHNIDSLNSALEATKSNLEQMTQTKNSIRVFGHEFGKSSYNSVMWTILAGLLVFLGIGFIAFKRNISFTITTKKELTELRTEFEAYRNTTRIAREKMSMDHFNEIKKLKKG